MPRIETRLDLSEKFYEHLDENVRILAPIETFHVQCGYRDVVAAEVLAKNV